MEGLLSLSEEEKRARNQNKKEIILQAHLDSAQAKIALFPTGLTNLVQKGSPARQ